MATTETQSELGRQIVEDAKKHVLYSWSVQDAINPIAVERAEGRYFYDYDGKSYLDFASQLVNVSIGHSHPKVVAGDQGPGREARDDRPADGDRVALTARQAARGGDAGRPDDVVLHERRRRGERERDQARALVHGTPQDHRPLPQLPRRDGRRDHADGRPAALGGRARHPRRRAHVRPVHLPLPCGSSRPVPGLHRRAAPRGDPAVRGCAHRCRRDSRDRHRHERDHRPARRLPAVDPRGLRPARHPADRRRGDGRIRTHRQVVRRRQLGRRARHPHRRQGDQLRLRAARRHGRARADRRLGARQDVRGRAHLQRASARVRLGRRVDRGLPGGRDRRAVRCHRRDLPQRAREAAGAPPVDRRGARARLLLGARARQEPRDT